MSDPTLIDLSWIEQDIAHIVGGRRHLVSQKRNSTPLDKQRFDNILNNNVEGVMGELTFAKYRNVYWIPSINQGHDETDVDGYEVKCTTWYNGCLPVTPSQEEKFDKPFALVTRERGFGRFRIRGYLVPREHAVKESPHFKQPDPERPPLWLFPQDMLRPFED